jgi:F-type H+-transporting ATPase subunit a
MAAEEALTTTQYITHHLTFLTKPSGDGSFWAVNVDSLVVSVVLGILAFGWFYRVALRATPGVPGKGQAFIELAVESWTNKSRACSTATATISSLALTVVCLVLDERNGLSAHYIMA